MTTAVIMSSIILLGTIHSTTEPNSSAVLSVSSDTKIVRSGEQAGDWILESIAPRQVTLQKGSLTVLLRAGDRLDEEDSVRVTTGLERSGDILTVSQSLRDFVTGTSLITILMQAATESVYNENGEFVGYRILDIDPGSIYDLAGIVNGDIVTHIDGIQVSSPVTALYLLKSVSAADKFTFTYIRGHETRTMKVAVR